MKVIAFFALAIGLCWALPTVNEHFCPEGKAPTKVVLAIMLIEAAFFLTFLGSFAFLLSTK